MGTRPPPRESRLRRPPCRAALAQHTGAGTRARQRPWGGGPPPHPGTPLSGVSPAPALPAQPSATTAPLQPKGSRGADITPLPPRPPKWEPPAPPAPRPTPLRSAPRGSAHAPGSQGAAASQRSGSGDQGEIKIINNNNHPLGPLQNHIAMATACRQRCCLADGKHFLGIDANSSNATPALLGERPGRGERGTGTTRTGSKRNEPRLPVRTHCRGRRSQPTAPEPAPPRHQPATPPGRDGSLRPSDRINSHQQRAIALLLIIRKGPKASPSV